MLSRIGHTFTKDLLENDHFKWSFSYTYFIKFHGKKFWELQHIIIIAKSVLDNMLGHKGHYFTKD